MKLEMELQMKKETKRTVVYTSNEPVAIDTVYVAKFALEQPYPKQIKLTVEAE
jgi:hypothetical protein